MSILNGLFGKREVKTEVAVECPHSVLLPQWSSVEDMGREDRISSFTCEACHEPFTAEAGMAQRTLIAERLRDLAQTGT
jgi:hypothetical protein